MLSTDHVKFGPNQSETGLDQLIQFGLFRSEGLNQTGRIKFGPV